MTHVSYGCQSISCEKIKIVVPVLPLAAPTPGSLQSALEWRRVRTSHCWTSPHSHPQTQSVVVYCTAVYRLPIRRQQQRLHTVMTWARSSQSPYCNYVFARVIKSSARRRRIQRIPNYYKPTGLTSCFVLYTHTLAMDAFACIIIIITTTTTPSSLSLHTVLSTSPLWPPRMRRSTRMPCRRRRGWIDSTTLCCLLYNIVVYNR